MNRKLYFSNTYFHSHFRLSFSQNKNFVGLVTTVQFFYFIRTKLKNILNAKKGAKRKLF